LETFRFLKGRSRVIFLADYNVEKGSVLAVPHRMLLGARGPSTGSTATRGAEARIERLPILNP